MDSVRSSENESKLDLMFTNDPEDASVPVERGLPFAPFCPDIASKHDDGNVRGEAGALRSGVLQGVLEQLIPDMLLLRRRCFPGRDSSHCEPVSCPASRLISS